MSSKVRRIDVVKTHIGMHADEMLAKYSAIKCGQEHFRIAADVPVDYVSAYLSRHEAEAFGPGALCLGVGFGPFDDHGEKNKEACCELMAKYLGIREDPRLVKLIGAVARLDKEKSSTGAMTLPRLIKLAHRYEYEPAGIIDWANAAFDAIIAAEQAYLDQVCERNAYIGNPDRFEKKNKRDFLSGTRAWESLELNEIVGLIPQKLVTWWSGFVDEVLDTQQKSFAKALDYAKRLVQTIVTPSGRKRVLLVDATASKTGLPFYLEFDSASRCSGVQADFVIVRNPRGNTVISANKTARTNLKEFAGLIRQAEANARGYVISKDRLHLEGTLEECTYWHVQENIGFSRLMNGSESRPDVENSMLSLEQIRLLLCQSLGMDVSDEVDPSVAA